MTEGVRKDMGECWKRGAKVDVTNQKKRLFMLSDKQVMGMRSVWMTGSIDLDSRHVGKDVGCIRKDAGHVGMAFSA